MKYFLVATHVKHGKVYIIRWNHRDGNFLVSQSPKMIRKFNCKLNELTKFRTTKR